MRITIPCTECNARIRTDVSTPEPGTAPATSPELPTAECRNCGAQRELIPNAEIREPLPQCLVCGCRELVLRKAFPQGMGITIVVIGFLISSIAWFYHRIYLTYSILFATAVIDFVLYLMLGNVLQCYRCRAEYRGLEGLEEFEPFNLETHERYRQEAARLQEAQKVAN